MFGNIQELRWKDTVFKITRQVRRGWTKSGRLRYCTQLSFSWRSLLRLLGVRLRIIPIGIRPAVCQKVKRCQGSDGGSLQQLCDLLTVRWAFKALPVRVFQRAVQCLRLSQLAQAEYPFECLKTALIFHDVLKSSHAS